MVPPSVCPELYAVIVSPLSGGENGDASGWCGCEYLSGVISEKYRAMSSGVGDCRSRFWAATVAGDCA